MLLRHNILERLDVLSLHKLDLEYPSLCVDEELALRLSRRDDSIEILNFIIENKIKKSNKIEAGLLRLKNNFFWSIGCVYDYRFGTIKNIEIRLGSNFGKYKINGKPIIFDWLNCNYSKFMLREITSDNYYFRNLSFQVDFHLTSEVRELLLHSQRVNVEVLILKENCISFLNSPPFLEVENFSVIPYSISSSFSKIQLLPEIPNAKTLIYNIPINICEEVAKYKMAMSI